MKHCVDFVLVFGDLESIRGLWVRSIAVLRDFTTATLPISLFFLMADGEARFFHTGNPDVLLLA